MLARSIRATLVAVLMVATTVSAMAACVVISIGHDDMDCCKNGVMAAAAATAPDCCRITSPVQTQVAETRALPDLKSIVASSPIEGVQAAPIIRLRAAHAVHTAAAKSPPILELSSALRL